MDTLAQLLTKSFAGNTPQTYLTAVLLIGLGFILSRGLRWLLGGIFNSVGQLTKNTVDDLLLSQAIRPVTGIFFLLFWYAAGLLLKMPVTLRLIYHNVLFVVGAVFVGAFALGTLDIFFRKVLEPKIHHSGFDTQIAVFIRKFLKMAAIVLVAAITLEHIGLDVLSLITGLGIGGLAVALAAQQTLGNVLGSIQILSDRPFSVGDWIRINGYWGEVTEIGLRSTKLRTRGKILVIIPNNKIAEAPIENVSVGRNLAVNLELGLVYQTTAARLQEAVDILTTILDEQEGVLSEKLIHFLAFDASSLTIKCTYFVTSIGTFWDVQHQVNLRIKERFDQAGLDFAFPTQTLHVASMAGS
ncbi:MAG: mechanosensitive ion channel family protein [Myxococcota bacterium]|nr:mechanosensitive ion channel family protein [Myxococcota bacterium]